MAQDESPEVIALWQSSYSELYFTNVLWPDFS
ncbi:MAG: undecaprenyl diphosphate synthase family protein [Holosporales bacterium]|nr:undecaprenyl diphosphate synthase family protein [Holosporales bacterium]